LCFARKLAILFFMANIPQQIPFGTPGLRSVVPVVTRYGDRWDVFGTAVIVAPGLALTALHVVEECLRVHHGHRLERGKIHNLDVASSMEAIQISGEQSYAVWRVTKVASRIDYSDLAWLQMTWQGPTRGDLDEIRLTLLPPKRGSEVQAFAYRGGRVLFDGKRVNVAIEAVTVRGRVIEVHPEKRDPAFLNFASFQTDARFDPAMSGGAVFDESGSLCGVVCSGFNVEPGAEEISYAALLWPCVATRLDASPFDGRRVYDLAAAGTINVKGLDRFVFLGADEIGFNAEGIDF